MLVAVVALAVSTPALAQSQARPADAQLIEQLRAGGHVIVVRHGATFNDQADTDPLNPDNIAKQRQLSPKGEEAARAFGQALKQIGVPVTKVVTSHFNRAYQTARLAGFDNAEKTADVAEGGLVVTPNENSRRAAALRKLASTVPPAGTSVLVVTHKPNVLDAFGRDWFEVKEGEATVFKPDGTGYTVVARIQMDEWRRLASAAQK
jgi:phosphohistidine phosphatase SixA